jgi:cytochrome oxidase Cu insertion factor (SCO1/SenC/PrrC family)
MRMEEGDPRRNEAQADGDARVVAAAETAHRSMMQRPYGVRVKDGLHTASTRPGHNGVICMDGLGRLRLLAVALAAVLQGCSVASHGATAGPSASIGPKADYGPAADFRLPNVAGGRFHLADEAAKRRVVVLTFITADCHEECPKVEAVLRSAAQKLARTGKLGRNVEIATVELDPKGNSAAAVGELRKKLWPRPGWAFLRGSVPETTAVLQAYGVVVQPRTPGKDLVHSSYVYLIDDRLRQVDLFALDVNLTPAKLIRSVENTGAHQAQDAARL